MSAFLGLVDQGEETRWCSCEKLKIQIADKILMDRNYSNIARSAQLHSHLLHTIVKMSPTKTSEHCTVYATE